MKNTIIILSSLISFLFSGLNHASDVSTIKSNFNDQSSSDCCPIWDLEYRYNNGQIYVSCIPGGTYCCDDFTCES